MASTYDLQNQGKELENLLRLKGYGLPKPAPTSTAIPSAAAVAENLMTPETAATPFVPQIQRKKSVTDTTKKGLLKQFDTGSAVTEGLQTDTKEQSVTPTYGDPAETMRLLKEYQGAPEAVGLRENAENLRGMAQELAGRSPSGFAGLDLSPLIAYADAKSGMNLLKGYNAPKGGRMYDTIALMKEADKVESQAAGLPLQYLKATQGQKISGITGKESLTTKDTANEKMAQTLNEIKTKLDSQGTGGNDSKALAQEKNLFARTYGKKLSENGAAIQVYDESLSTLREGGPTSFVQAVKSLINATEGKKITDDDYKLMAKGDPALEVKIRGAISKAVEGFIAPPEDVALLEGSIANLRSSKAGALLKMHETLKRSGRSTFPNYMTAASVDDIFNINTGYDIGELKQKRGENSIKAIQSNIYGKEIDKFNKAVDKFKGKAPSAPSFTPYTDPEKEAKYQKFLLERKASQKKLLERKASQKKLLERKASQK